MESPDREVPLYLDTELSLVCRVQIERFHRIFPFSKPISLHEHEISLTKYLQGAKHQKSSAKTPAKLDSGESEGEEEGEEFEGDEGGDYPTDSGVSRKPAAALDENFVRSFLSGDLCLRGVRINTQTYTCCTHTHVTHNTCHTPAYTCHNSKHKQSHTHTHTHTHTYTHTHTSI